MKMNSLNQFFTSAWASEILFDAHFNNLGINDLVWEPTCGTGNMLAAIPEHIPCIGTEIDPPIADQARKNTGREIITGNCLTIKLPQGITAIFGNPPFNLELFEKLLNRCSEILELGTKAGFLIPAYFLQTSRTVIDLGRKWTISSEIIPRDVFPGLSKPLVFASFTRDNFPRLIGFRLFTEVSEMRQLSKHHQELFSNKIKGPRSVWKEAVTEILQELGGKASLTIIYQSIEGKRPTDNSHWKEQIRKVLQKSFVRTETGVYSLPN